MTTMHRRARVLHSMRAPGAETRYANHMAAVESAEFEMRFFTWRTALFGRYEIFHLHWPEQLAGHQSGVGGWLRDIRLRALLARLRRRQTPVVYTLHNHRPHDGDVSPRLARAYRGFAALTRVEIHLVPEPGHESSAMIVQIPHGGYREPFARYPQSAPTPGRVVTFGIIKRYKGIERLLEVFSASDDPEVSLRIVGEPADAVTVCAIDAAIHADSRVSARYGFLSDRDLVAEVTASRLVVLPYDELHSSGAVLVALSLDRPVLVPRSPTSEALRDEVGPEWVHVFEPPLSPSAISDALAGPAPAGRPALDAREWDRVSEAHTDAYRRALNGSQGTSCRGAPDP